MKTPDKRTCADVWASPQCSPSALTWALAAAELLRPDDGDDYSTNDVCFGKRDGNHFVVVGSYCTTPIWSPSWRHLCPANSGDNRQVLLFPNRHNSERVRHHKAHEVLYFK